YPVTLLKATFTYSRSSFSNLISSFTSSSVMLDSGRRMSLGISDCGILFDNTQSINSPSSLVITPSLFNTLHPRCKCRTVISFSMLLSKGLNYFHYSSEDHPYDYNDT